MTHTEETGARKKWWIRGAIAGVVVALIVGGLVVFLPRLFENTITAYFPTTTGLYSGDDVRVLGVKVGSVGEIEPGPDFAKVTMSVDKSVDIPADAKAIIVAPSLVSGRFVQLTPVYAGGPTMQDGADIPVERTAVPVEWDEIKSELNKLSKRSDRRAPTRRDRWEPSSTPQRTTSTATVNPCATLCVNCRRPCGRCPTDGPICSPPSGTCKHS